MAAGIRHHLFDAGFRAIAATRADRWLRPVAQGAGVILMFHHVRPWRERAFAPNRLLEITPEFFDRALRLVRDLGFDIVPLDGVPERLARGRAGPPFAVLTFDDGYRDNALYALPILRRYEAPWTLFVTSDFASGRGHLWWLELEEAIARLDRIVLSLDGDTVRLPSETPEQKQAAFETLYWRLRAGPEEGLLAATARLAEAAGLGAGALAGELCLSWDEVSVLSREPGLTIGAHTASHPMLAKHGEGVARHEIVEGRAAIEHRLGVPVRHFAYPVGDRTSAGAREFRLAREAGFATAVTTRPGHLFAEHAAHPFALPRVSVNGLHQTEAALRALLSGVPFLAWNRGRRVDVA